MALQVYQKKNHLYYNRLPTLHKYVWWRRKNGALRGTHIVTVWLLAGRRGSKKRVFDLQTCTDTYWNHNDWAIAAYDRDKTHSTLIRWQWWWYRIYTLSKETAYLIQYWQPMDFRNISTSYFLFAITPVYNATSATSMKDDVFFNSFISSYKLIVTLVKTSCTNIFRSLLPRSHPLKCHERSNSHTEVIGLCKHTLINREFFSELTLSVEQKVIPSIGDYSSVNWRIPVHIWTWDFYKHEWGRTKITLWLNKGTCLKEIVTIEAVLVHGKHGKGFETTRSSVNIFLTWDWTTLSDVINIDDCFEHTCQLIQLLYLPSKYTGLHIFE